MSDTKITAYDPSAIESRWQQNWRNQHVYRVGEDKSKPKYYVLDMFPYPSGAGLHVGHPLGYIASDIVARYKRLCGYNVLHPMGYDAFGLPAEQYAIQTGQHPAVTTDANIKRYREQLDKIGFSFDWEREVRTSEPNYYRWTQWIFLQLFASWYNPRTNKAEPIETLVAIFAGEGFKGEEHDILTGNIEQDVLPFTAAEWKAFDEEAQQKILLNFRIAYLSEAYVNWCPALGTVLSNDEVKDGVSERGGHPVERKLMKQWSMRITSYAERLLNDLDTIEWSESIKETQRNWIGKSTGASVHFAVQGSELNIEVFTTRPDTIFGVSFLAVAPEYENIQQLITPAQAAVANAYIEQAKNRSERERQADVKRVSGEFTGSYVIHPFTQKPVPVWVADYVLAGYGTGAVMGVPAHDSRDHAFAKHFGLPIVQVIEPMSASAGGGKGEETPPAVDIQTTSYDAKDGRCINSDFLNGLTVKEAISKAIDAIQQKGIGRGTTNYRLRDAIFGRQRYWGEPIPVYYKNGIPYPMPEDELPLVLPEVDKFLPTEDGEPPLARAKNWKYKGQYDYEWTTMPGWAGSSWYFLRYMDPKNTNTFAGREAMDYWQNVDLYLGGSEHATGHLLYVRFWTKFLYDRGFISANEPAKKLVNQGMIQGVSSKIQVFVYSNNYSIYSEGHVSKDGSQSESKSNFVFISNKNGEHITENWGDDMRQIFYSRDYLPADIEEIIQDRTIDNVVKLNIDIDFVEDDILDIQALIKEKPDYYNSVFICEGGYWHKGEFHKKFESYSDKFLVSHEVEKMSKSKWNVVNPDDIIDQYGADTLRLYEMFLGPLEQSKPWSTQGIEGTFRFLKKLWKLFYDDKGEWLLTDEAANAKELKTLHKTIKKIQEDIENLSFNTSVSAFMVCVNELGELDCHKRSILEPLVICLCPFAPHICEELWSQLGNSESVVKATFPKFDAQYLVESSFSYPISINGKVRTNIEMPLDMDSKAVEDTVMRDEIVQKWLEGKQPKKVIHVKGRIVNVVI